MNPLAVLMPGFVGTILPEWLKARLEEGLGGVCIFGENVESPSQLAALTAAIHAANPRAIVTIDEEGGDVSRLYQREGSPFPGNAILGRLDSLDATAQVAARVGEELRAVGVDLTLAPDVDVNSNPLNPVIGVRSFGEDPGLVARHSAAWVEGVQSQGVSACAKHFPGHGDAAQDSHHALPTIDASAETLAARELPPFAAAIAAGTATIMTSHIMVPALDPESPATLSRAILVDLLRTHMGFDGVVVTDALDMAGASAGRGIPAAAVLALAGGADFLCIGTRNTDEQLAEICAAIDAAVASGDLPAARLADACGRVAVLGDRHRAVREAGTVSGGAGGAGGLGGVGAVAGGAGGPVAVDRNAPSAPPSAASALPSPTLVADSFAVTDAARSAIAESHPRVWLKLEPAANMAVGASPWGPFAVGVHPDFSLSAGAPAGSLENLTSAITSGSLAVVVGKDNHRHPWAVDAIAAARARAHEVGATVVVVDMGWPGADRSQADIATFGASRLAGAALLELIGN